MKRVLAAALLCLAGLSLVACGTAVPDVKGKTATQAGEVLVAAGFKVGAVTYDEKAVEASGSVISQTPEAGATAQAGSAVSLVVAGAAPVPTPSLLGLDRAAAEAALAAAGLTLGAAIEAYDASATAGTVASQTPVPGVEAAKGSAVAVVISKGPEPVAVPSVVGKTKADAIALLEAAGFKVKAANKDNKAKKSTVFAQSPAAGKLAQPGSTVTVSVSTGVVMVTVPNLYGKWYDTSEAILRKLGLRYHERINEDELGPYGGVGPGEIYRQSPKAGASVPRGTIVTISFNIYE